MLRFDFAEPATLAEALSLLDQHGEEACVFGGGSALILALRRRMVAPSVVVSLAKLDGLRDITWSETKGLRIGAMARHAEIAAHPVVRTHYPVLSQVFSNLANPQVRNQGTIGGNLCYADPATDPPSCLMSLDAVVTIAGPLGQRRARMRDFLVDFFTTALEPGEILIDICVPPPVQGRVGHYRRHLRTPAEHRPIANAALAFTMRESIWDDVRVVIGASVPVAQRMDRAAELLTARRITLDTAAEAAALVAEDMNPISDGRGDATFRTRMVQATVRRLICDAAGLDWRNAA